LPLAYESVRDMLSSQSETQCRKGLSLIRRLCQDNPVNLQEYIDVVCRFIREKALHSKALHSSPNKLCCQ
jgi:hypothetical protein